MKTLYNRGTHNNKKFQRHERNINFKMIERYVHTKGLLTAFNHWYDRPEIQLNLLRAEST